MKKSNKEESKTRLHKLTAYAATAGAVLALGNVANAQYVIDNMAISGATSSLNLDGLGTVSSGDDIFLFALSGTTYGTFAGGRANGNASLIKMGASAYSPIRPLLAGSIIDGTKQWNTQLGNIIGSGNPPSHPAGVFPTGTAPTNKRFIGVKIIRGGQPYYGWVAIRVNSASSIYVYDHYISPTANTPVQAGATTPVPAAIPVSPWSVALAGGLIGLGGLVAARKRKTA